MTEKIADEPLEGETEPAEDAEATQESPEPDETSEREDEGDLDADEVEQELLDAMKKLRRTNKNVEEYLDGIAREVEQPAPPPTDTPDE